MHSCSDVLGSRSAKKKVWRQTLGFAENLIFHFVLRLECTLTEVFPHSLSPTVRGAQLSKQIIPSQNALYKYF